MMSAEHKTGLNKEVLRLALPSIFANITVPLVGIVDTIIVGHIGQAAAIGGIAVGTMLFDLLYWNFGFLRVGTAGMTAQAYGRGDRQEARAILGQALAVAGGAAAVIWLLQWVFVTVALALVPCSAEVASFARRYFFVRVWAAPATLMLMAFKGWFIGMQNTVAPMVCDLVVNGMNMLGSWLLAVRTPLGAVGVAWGTLLAQYTGLIVAIILMARTFLQTGGGGIAWREALHKEKMKRLFVLNGNLFVRSLCFLVVYVGFPSLAASYGDTDLASSTIMLKLFMPFSYFIDGFAYAGEALTGRFVGEQNREGMRQTVRILVVWTTAIGLVCTALYAVAGEGMFALMTDDRETRLAALPYLPWLTAMPLFSCMAFLLDGIFIGATAGAELRNSMLLAAAAFPLTYILFRESLGLHALYIAYLAHSAMRTLYLTARWRFTFKKLFP